MNKLQNKRVVVAMSGGVDSSVAAALLVEQGYDVVGMMMRLWSEPSQGAAAPVNRCCTPDQMADARRVADHLNIPFYVIDVQDYFRKTIVQFFIDEHENGRTPNPCIECNREIRFTHLLNHALALDADYLATGHYARVQATPDGYHLLKGVDDSKDQSYVLHVLSQQQLAQVLFPVGDYEKTVVRELATTFNLPVAAKQDSQDLCFLGDGDYRRFLRDYSDKVNTTGPIIDQDGVTIGQHNGLAFYTIGQRKGLGVSTSEPVFVLKKEKRNNVLVVGPREMLGQQSLIARNVNWISGTAPQEPIHAQVKVRYKARGIEAEVVGLGNGRMQVQFKEPVTGITPGQGAVCYAGERCLGGGIIADFNAQGSFA
ncbi:MAG: tRNA 2-thiouridine(34) synthase MnmA [Anaerolineales bacterium]|nr:tRNA 2-thiouridine(34) synthase MnmA [Anaerolineales bacterium]